MAHKYFCDYCGREIIGDVYDDKYSVYGKTLTLEATIELSGHDLCEGCVWSHALTQIRAHMEQKGLEIKNMEGTK